MPSAPTLESIGAGYVLDGNQRQCRPRLETWQKFERGAKKILALERGRHRLAKEDVLHIIGLLGHVA